MKKSGWVCGLSALSFIGPVFAAEGPVPTGIPNLDHVFVIVMENHGFGQIVKNPYAPFTNQYAAAANLATNYFGVAHPSLANHLEIVGGSNFGVLSDNDPDWHATSCTTNLASGVPNTDNPASPAICPISGTGTDAAVAAEDCTNEYVGGACGDNIDGTHSYAATAGTVGKTIADQLVAAGRTWKTYQEDLPSAGPDLVTYSDGLFTNLTDFSVVKSQLNPPPSQMYVVQLYADKHNPFVYFQNIQAATTPGVGYAQMASFEGTAGLWGSLASGNLPSFSYIVPNQCNDEHGGGNGTLFCQYDPNDNGRQGGLNPGLIYKSDDALKRIVTAIKSSPVWKTQYNAIVVLWDENDFSNVPNTNQVVAIVDTSYGAHKVQSKAYYTHFSLLKSIEAGFNLPCLNHACDTTTAVMKDMFAF